MNSASRGTPSAARQALRKHLLAQREQFVAGPTSAQAGAALARHLMAVLSALEPEMLGLYWPHRSEFNAVTALAADSTFAKLPIALPFAQRAPVQMHYRVWDGQAPTLVDDCGIASSGGAPVVPDVVLVPCVGFTGAPRRRRDDRSTGRCRRRKWRRGLTRAGQHERTGEDEAAAAQVARRGAELTTRGGADPARREARPR